MYKIYRVTVTKSMLKYMSVSSLDHVCSMPACDVLVQICVDGIETVNLLARF